ncbi:transcriptional regulator, TetR family [Streptoalloteichus tenebrarius]|uniref:Transcriptional regulator, TetR family n=1 Tax=Streptoalloteichus tenebrarius (strain ATCC 17920 / DSM 40477 / JCM 4838 / CBS 697.72 / NBRC 16177 / NCIMB 11028 / NRRL B-12390 / A12253. 1 / ISP 5477) TaxID=1933 RepID=A0ABT1HTJ6_STRSD|nr:TetR/AcrR family transcriptional regulator C-terminal domain-containing protein [Streptoalloteichus tenebrarius]MCP2258843.1 transcriptional regulator, TetR family [Streptoalloteichus tenebrarius]BFE99472.1 TetR/AcrR family transcriptional regulator C-terminal domain-containing protein [Streptoalloteichus tenebrarius]
MSVFAGQGDPTVSMTLLWATPEPGRARTAPGPKPALSVEAIVEAAIAVADAETVAGLSMRTVAERLGRSSMALYTYVPGKAELLDLMYDRVHAELSHDHDRGEGWRAAVTSWATELRAFYLRHPWVLQVSHARPVLGPHEQAVLETLLGLLVETRLPARTLRGVVNLLFNHVRGSSQTVAESQQAAVTTGTSDQDWWAARAAVLAEVAPDFAERFPRTVELGRDPAPSWDQQVEETFMTGLSVLLDGIEAATAHASPRDGKAD